MATRKYMPAAGRLLGAFLLAVLAATAMAAPVNAQDARPRILDYKKVELGNGLTVLLKEYHKLPLVYFQMTIAGGTAVDPEGKEGVANLTARLLRQGTERRTAAEIAEQLDFLGAELGASVSADFTTVTGEFLSKDLDTGLELLVEIMTGPVFLEEELERQRTSVLSQILRARESLGAIASQNFYAALYGSHPYGRPARGTEASVQGITREDIRQYHLEVYRPETSILAVVGDFQTEEMAAKIENAFRLWFSGTAGFLPERTQPVPPEKWQIVLVDKPDVTQTQIRIGSLGITADNPDYHAIQVANTILGGGFTSRLVEEIRVNRGLTYGASSFFVTRAEPGPFLLSTFSKNSTAFETLQVALAELKKYKDDGPTPDEIEKAKNYLSGQFWLRLQTPEALAAQMSHIQFYRLPADYVDTFQERLVGVTPEEVRRVIDRYFPYENLLLVVVTDAKQMKKQLEELGTVKVKSYRDDGPKQEGGGSARLP